MSKECSWSMAVDGSFLKMRERKIRSKEMSFRKLWMTGLTVSFGVLTLQAKTAKFAPPVPLTPAQTALVQKAIGQEKATVKAIQEHTPVVQTYIQNMRPAPKLYSIPESDQYMLGRVDFGKTFNSKGYKTKSTKHGFFKGSFKYVSG